MRVISLIILICCSLTGLAQDRLSLQAGTGIGVGWMIYHNGLSEDPDQVPLGYDRTYVALRIPAELELTWHLNRLSLGLGIHRSIMYDQIMIGSSDRRGNRNRYRITPGDEQLIFEGIWMSAAWTVNPFHKVTVSPGFRAGMFRSNTIHPAWEILGHPWIFTPMVDISWRIAKRMDWWFSAQYVHLWKNDSPESAPLEALHHHSIDIRTGIRFWML